MTVRASSTARAAQWLARTTADTEAPAEFASLERLDKSACEECFLFLRCGRSGASCFLITCWFLIAPELALRQLRNRLQEIEIEMLFRAAAGTRD